MTHARDALDVFPAGPACPFLSSVVVEQAAAYPTGCLCALRSGARRVPSRDELAWRCGNGGHRSCPTYRRSGGIPWLTR